jgi:hypothetical protein
MRDARCGITDYVPGDYSSNAGGIALPLILVIRSGVLCADAVEIVRLALDTIIRQKAVEVRFSVLELSAWVFNPWRACTLSMLEPIGF